MIPLVALVLVFAVSEARANSSLFLSKTEISGLEEKKPAHEQNMRLDGIVYNNHQSWAIWINGKVIYPSKVPEGIQIHEVTPNSAKISWTKNMEIVTETLSLYNTKFK